MIRVVQVSKIFTHQGKQKTALNAVSFEVQDGKITALLGPNGAGKTTLLRIMASLETATHGAVYLNDVAIAFARQEIGYLSDGCQLYAKLTAQENIFYFGQLHGITQARITQTLQTLAEPLGLAALLDRRVNGFSQGERMRVLIACALIHQPHTIILDEPTNGLDIDSVRRLRALLKHLASPQGGGHCILISSHVMSEVEKLADEVFVIAQGTIRARGTVQSICEQTQQQVFEEAFVKLIGATI